MSLFSQCYNPKAKTDVILLQELSKFDQRFQRELKAANVQTSNSSCTDCLGLFSKIKLPASFSQVVSWLVSLATKQAKGGFNEPVIISSLLLSLQFSIDTATGNNATIANALNSAIVKLAADFHLNLVADYQELSSYCQTNDITIPTALQDIINKNIPQPSPLTQAVA